MVEVKFVRTHEGAILPERNHKDLKEGDAGWDLFATETIEIPANDSVVVPIGLKVGFITPGYWFKIENRSGNGFKKGLRVHAGIIDNGYRGDLGVKVFNLTNSVQIVEKGKGVAQFIVYEMIQTEASWIEESIDTDRGVDGFGSSDNK